MTTRSAADIAEVVGRHFPGIVVQRNLVDVIAAWLIDHDAVSDDDVPTILAIANSLLPDNSGEDLPATVLPPYLPSTQPPYPLALPPYPTGMPRFPHSNEAPDGWTVDRGPDSRGEDFPAIPAPVTDETEVRGGKP